MKPQPFIVSPDDYEPALNVIGTKVTVLASSAATQGYEITLQQGDEGMGPPLHSHPLGRVLLCPERADRIQL